MSNITEVNTSPPGDFNVAFIEMFSGPQCSYCAQARALFERRGLSYVEYDVSEAEHLQEFRNRLPRLKALPQIFVNGDHIGSYEDLVILEGDGRLGKMINP